MQLDISKINTTISKIYTNNIDQWVTDNLILLPSIRETIDIKGWANKTDVEFIRDYKRKLEDDATPILVNNNPVSDITPDPANIATQPNVGVLWDRVSYALNCCVMPPETEAGITQMQEYMDWFTQSDYYKGGDIHAELYELYKSRPASYGGLQTA